MNTSCYLCGASDFSKVNGKLRDLVDVFIFKCNSCGLVFLENFDHVDDCFYENSHMRNFVGIQEYEKWCKECEHDDERRTDFIRPITVNRSILDFGCGAGGFLLKIQKFASSVKGIELEKVFREKINQSGIPVYRDLSEIKNQKFDIITLFHVLEHLKDPKKTLINLSDLLNKNGDIIIEVPNANDALLSLYKCKPFSEFTYWSCHLFLFDNSTLKKLVIDSGLDLKYIKQIQRYPLSNHLFWLSQGKPGGHKFWSFIDNPELNSAYERVLANLEICDTIIAFATVKQNK